jgi:hypothetical protein
MAPLFRSAKESRIAFTWQLLMPVKMPSSRATVPVTCGVAKLVPELSPNEPLKSHYFEINASGTVLDNTSRIVQYPQLVFQVLAIDTYYVTGYPRSKKVSSRNTRPAHKPVHTNPSVQGQIFFGCSQAHVSKLDFLVKRPPEPGDPGLAGAGIVLA